MHTNTHTCVYQSERILPSFQAPQLPPAPAVWILPQGPAPTQTRSLMTHFPIGQGHLITLKTPPQGLSLEQQAPQLEFGDHTRLPIGNSCRGAAQSCEPLRVAFVHFLPQASHVFYVSTMKGASHSDIFSPIVSTQDTCFHQLLILGEMTHDGFAQLDPLKPVSSR